MGRGSASDSFWSCVRQKIDEKLCESKLHEYYQNYRIKHPEEKDQRDNLEEDEFEEPISPPLGPVSLVNHRLITTEEQ